MQAFASVRCNIRLALVTYNHKPYTHTHTHIHNAHVHMHHVCVVCHVSTRTTAGGCGDPPHDMSRSDDRSSAGNRGCVDIIAAMVEATLSTLTRSRSV